jgi:DNA-binding NtrC family response regulator
MVTYTLYIVDDEESIRKGITMAFESDYHITSFPDAHSAIDATKENPPDLVLLDIGLPDMSGIEVLRKIRHLNPEILVIMITAYEDINTVISAMKLGAYDYVLKPLQIDTLKVTVENALETIRLRKEVQTLQEEYLKENLPCFIGESNVIQDVMQFIGMVARSPDTPILILGETGTGKELIASAIHYRSPNFKGPLITVNCASIPKDLIESELFGYEKGAFSGASTSGKKGLIEEAADGTLFLDEVGDLSLDAQAKLLRFLEEGEFYRVGGTKKSKIHTRVVSATNKDLDSMIERDLFRNDLYFRLGVIKVEVPSLNERHTDIIPIAKYFLLEFSKKFTKTFTGFSQDAEKALLEHQWTGNVRELKNILERGVLIGKGPEITHKDLGMEETGKKPTEEQRKNEVSPPPLTTQGINLTNSLESLEKHYIKTAITLAEGNETKAAKLLGMNHHTFRYRRKKLQVE